MLYREGALDIGRVDLRAECDLAKMNYRLGCNSFRHLSIEAGSDPENALEPGRVEDVSAYVDARRSDGSYRREDFSKTSLVSG
jgi:hypothetical protein